MGFDPMSIEIVPLLATKMTSVVQGVDAFYQTQPFFSAFLTCGAKASAADYLAQTSQNSVAEEEVTDPDTTQPILQLQSKEEADAEAEADVEDFQKDRNLAFIIYGGLYTGITQEYIYNTIFPMLFGTGTDLRTVATEVIFDQCIVSTTLCLPIAYLVKAIVFGYPIQEGFRRYINDIRYNGLLFKFWSIWIPVQCLTFSVVPEHLRIVFIAFVSFFWLILLSTISSQTAEEECSTS